MLKPNGVALAVLCIWLLFTPSTGYTQEMRPHISAPVLWVAPGLELDHSTGGWIQVSRFAGPHRTGNRWADLEAVLGSGWRLLLDHALGTPTWILGPGYETGIAPLDETEAIRTSRHLVSELAGDLGIDDVGACKLMHTAVTRGPHGSTLLGVDFKQTLSGYDVRTLHKPCRVFFRYDLTLGKLSNLGSDWVAGLEVDVSGAMGREAVVQCALDLIPAYVPGSGRVLTFDTFVLVGMENEAGLKGRLVHSLRIQTDAPPHLWALLLDARTGEKLYVADHLCAADVVGNVCLGSLDSTGGTPPAVPFSVKPARSLDVSVLGGQTATTDANGDFRIPHTGAAPVTVAGRYAGRWCSVYNYGSTGTTFSRSATPGTPVGIVLNGAHTTEFATAEATAYDWVTRCHFFVENVIPGFNGLPRLPVNVNVLGSCNAYWTGSGITTYRAGNNCNNTAIPEVIAHEWGHAFHQWCCGPIMNSAFSEGIADHIGLYLTGQRIMGRGFTVTGGAVRDYRPGRSANNTQWPRTGNPSIHRDGQIWAGAMLDLRDHLMAKHGATTGASLAEAITIAQFLRKPPDMPTGIREILVQDDNDANLLNGTPNFAEIAAAADRHNLPRPPDPDIIRFTHSPVSTRSDVVNDCTVSAGITSTAGTITSTLLTYWIGTGPAVTLTMNRGAGEVYSADIPAQPAMTRIRYAITAVDTGSNTASSPPFGTHEFTVGREVVFFADDFEIDRGWTAAPDDSAVTGRFERTDPVAAYHGTVYTQPDDDHTPGAGSRCYVTRSGWGGPSSNYHDVDSGKTSILSPTFRLDRTSACIDFAYHFVTYAGSRDRLHLGVSSDNGQTWRDFWSEENPANCWKEVTGLQIPGPCSPAMKIRFWTSDSPNDSVTDACIDDVRIYGIDDNVAALRARTRSPGRGTLLNFTLDAAREPYAFFLVAFSATLDPVSLPGLGVTDLGHPRYPLWQGVLSASGSCAFPIAIPPLAGLKGVKLHAQALVSGTAVLFSNVWTVDIQ